jgi:hypothetical protein
MSLLLHELQEKLLQKYDADSLLELLDITAEELLDNFQDRIAEKYTELVPLIESLDEDSDNNEV